MLSNSSNFLCCLSLWHCRRLLVSSYQVGNSSTETRLPLMASLACRSATLSCILIHWCASTWDNYFHSDAGTPRQASFSLQLLTPTSIDSCMFILIIAKSVSLQSTLAPSLRNWVYDQQNLPLVPPLQISVILVSTEQ